MPYLVAEPELETKLQEAINRSDFKQIRDKYDDLLNRLGNVEGDECIALVLIALNTLKP